jgi:hypothetical protein
MFVDCHGRAGLIGAGHTGTASGIGCGRSARWVPRAPLSADDRQVDKWKEEKQAKALALLGLGSSSSSKSEK